MDFRDQMEPELGSGGTGSQPTFQSFPNLGGFGSKPGGMDAEMAMGGSTLQKSPSFSFPNPGGFGSKQGDVDAEMGMDEGTLQKSPSLSFPNLGGFGSKQGGKDAEMDMGGDFGFPNLGNGSESEQMRIDANSSMMGELQQSPRIQSMTGLPLGTGVKDSSVVSSINLKKKRDYGMTDLAEGNHPIAGTGTQWHKFSSGKFPDTGTADQYFQETGLSEDSEIDQLMGGATSRLMLSRRGSIGGRKENEDGSVDVFRWSSFPTSTALGSNTGDQEQFFGDYTQTANQMKVGAHYIKQNKTMGDESTNTVASDFGQVQWDPENGFQLTNPTFASGFSAQGVNKAKPSMYEKGYEAAEVNPNRDTSKSIRPEQTHHSEPMNLDLHEKVRKQSMESQSDVIGMVTSVPNQVCKNCGRMYQHAMGERSLVSGMPGKEYGGQKAGFESDEKLGKGTAYRATPIETLQKDGQNEAEVRNIGKWHAP